MAMMDPFDDRVFVGRENYNEWGPWVKRFAWKPTSIDGSMIWAKSYYSRSGLMTNIRHYKSPDGYVSHEAAGPAKKVIQNGTIFDVLKEA